MKTLAHIGLVVAIPIFALGAIVAPQLSSLSRAEPLPATMPPPSTEDLPAAAPDTTSDPVDQNDQNDDSESELDLYGNEVTSAVAKYKFDGTGALYELHSPQTEVPKLAPPKT